MSLNIPIKCLMYSKLNLLIRYDYHHNLYTVGLDPYICIFFSFKTQGRVPVNELTGMYSSRRPPGNIPCNLGPKPRSDNNVNITDSVIIFSIAFSPCVCPYNLINTSRGSALPLSLIRQIRVYVVDSETHTSSVIASQTNRRLLYLIRFTHMSLFVIFFQDPADGHGDDEILSLDDVHPPDERTYVRH
ncbi:hypothetical protein AGLY_013219 [Aphis glycines]|uniref:Uncharacterized protein n=1 Tax=Aphis glycines TaxID=307491 RepID=A0A6G0T5P3_APHGL|nr:hypothetical protein AGLY_013219 [Aphis glycines]